MIKKASAIFMTRKVNVGEFVVDIRTNRRTDSKRKVVIMVHGIGVSEKYFRRLADTLTSRYDVMSINLPGYGETKKPSRALSLDELTHVLAQFIRHENISNPIIIGQSMGCQISARLSSMPDIALDKLILISPTVNVRERTAPLQFFRLMQDILREPFALNLIIFMDYIKFGFLRYLKTQRYMIADEIEASLLECTQSTLIIRGEKDKIVPIEWVQFLLTRLRNGSLVEVKGGPHNVQFTHPKEVARICVDFIDR